MGAGRHQPAAGKRGVQAGGLRQRVLGAQALHGGHPDAPVSLPRGALKVQCFQKISKEPAPGRVPTEAIRPNLSEFRIRGLGRHPSQSAGRDGYGRTGTSGSTARDPSSARRAGCVLNFRDLVFSLYLSYFGGNHE